MVDFMAGGALAAWSPERLALLMTVVLVLLTVGVIVLCLQAFDKGVRNGKKPSRLRGQFYARVIGWMCLALVIGGSVWYFDESLFDRLSQMGM